MVLVTMWSLANLRVAWLFDYIYRSCSVVVADVGFGATATGTGLFGQQQQQQQTQQQSTGTSLFGNTAFGAAKPMFGAATTTASTPFGGLSTAGAGTTLFGQANQNKVSATCTYVTGEKSLRMIYFS